ncbi:MAG: hypothetical protein ACKOZX_07405, partial [Gammaproteobacteria bacterium]
TGLAFTLLPALFVVLRIPPDPKVASDRALQYRLPEDRLPEDRLPEDRTVDTSPTRLVITRSSRLILGSTLVLALLAGWQAREVEFDYSVLALRDADKEGMQTLLELQDRGITTDYSIVTLVPDDAAARALRERLRALPEVGAVQIPSDLVPTDQTATEAALAPLRALLRTLRTAPVPPTAPPTATEESERPSATAMDAAAAGLTRLADSAADEQVRQTAAELRDRIEPLLRAGDSRAERARDALDRAEIDTAIRRAVIREIEGLRAVANAQPFTLNDLPADLRARLIDAEGRHLMTIQPAGAIATHEATGQFIEAVAAVAPNYAGRAVVEWGVVEVVVMAFLEAVALAVGGIALLLVVYYRGLLLPLCALVPLTLTTMFTFAGMVVFDIDFNMANILVVPLIFGLGVDSGIHVIDRFQHGGGVGAIYASSTARAVIISALTTIGTFFSLSFSPHKGAASIGLLLTGAISLMLVMTLVVLPSLLQLLPQRLSGHSNGHSND